MNRSIKNRNLKKDLLLQQCFDFTIAGKAHVFISKLRDKYLLVVYGVHIVEDVFAFTPNYKYRYKFDSLYMAILAFNKIVTLLCSSVEWYSPELFETDLIYDEIFIKD